MTQPPVRGFVLNHSSCMAPSFNQAVETSTLNIHDSSNCRLNTNSPMTKSLSGQPAESHSSKSGGERSSTFGEELSPHWGWGWRRRWWWLWWWPNGLGDLQHRSNSSAEVCLPDRLNDTVVKLNCCQQCVCVCSRCRPLSKSVVAGTPKVQSFQVSSFIHPFYPNFVIKAVLNNTFKIKVYKTIELQLMTHVLCVQPMNLNKKHL